MTSTNVAVVLLNWNGWRDTVRCLESLRMSGIPSAQIVVVDNASSDDSVTKIRDAFPKQQLIVTSQNLGFGGGCNIGIKYALYRKPDYIWLLNNDTTIETTTLASLIETTEADPSIGVTGSVIYEATRRERIQLWGGGSINLWLGRCRLRRAPAHLDFISGASMLLRTSALKEVGLFDESRYFMYWEDADLCFRLRKLGWRITTAATSRVWHFGSASLGKSSPKIDEYFVRSAVRFFQRHAPSPRLAITALVFSLLAKRIVFFRLNNFFAVLRGLRAS